VAEVAVAPRGSDEIISSLRGAQRRSNLLNPFGRLLHLTPWHCAGAQRQRKCLFGAVRVLLRSACNLAPPV
jgi:hypothetical protein